MAPLGSCQDYSPAEALHTSQGELSYGAPRAGQKQKFSVWCLASWNVRTLLDIEGSIMTARQRNERVAVDERKIDQVVSELNRYNVVVAALQETKWFGNEIYRVEDSVVLTSGREVPEHVGSRQRGEGVAIVLLGPAVSAWKAGGSRWKAWSSRLITVSLKTGRRKCDQLHVLSCYAPTFAACRSEKDAFFDDLQQAISEIPSTEPFVMLGDFNARVGSRVEDDEWWYERGPHGYGDLNEAGKELLSFLSANEATVCNTLFEKKDIYKQTWQHPKSKLYWHCIDYAIMKRMDR